MAAYHFINRKKDYDKLLMVLSGYKHDIWDKVFNRLIKYIDEDIDVCIVTSGLENKQLMRLAEIQSWSYLSTDINNLCFAQNACIECHPKATHIFKMDEDIFVTKNVFTKLYEDFYDCTLHTDFIPSAIVPMINVNCTTYIEVLRRAGHLREFVDKFGDVKITNGLHHNRHILEDPNVAEFIWNNISIDDEELVDKEFCVWGCPTRFSIGLIMFPRSTWERMNGFDVLLDSEKDYERKGLGVDERELCKFAMSKAMPLMVDCRCLVGHLGYGPQTNYMIEYFKMHLEKF